MRLTYFVCAFLSLSLLAAYTDGSATQEQQEGYRDFWHVFPEWRNIPQKMLEIKLVRQDKSICGAYWCVSSTDDQIWKTLGYEIQNNMCCNDPISAQCVQEVCEQFKDLLSKKHDSVSPIPGVPMITEKDMAGVLNPPPVKPWAVSLTTEMLRDKNPGTLCLIPQGSRSGLLHDTESIPLENAVIVQQTEPQGVDGCLLRETQAIPSENAMNAFAEGIKALQDTMGALSVCFNDAFYDFSKRMVACEQNLKNANRRLTALEKDKYKQTACPARHFCAKRDNVSKMSKTPKKNFMPLETASHAYKHHV